MSCYLREGQFQYWCAKQEVVRNASWTGTRGKTFLEKRHEQRNKII